MLRPLVVAIALAVSAPAAADNYATWKQYPHAGKVGFVMAVVSHMTIMCDPEEYDPGCVHSMKRMEHYRGCLDTATASTIVELVDSFVARHPEHMSYTPLFFVHNTVVELCGPPPS
jgi:hypothetical protein